MPVVEYKFHKVPEGGMRSPDFVADAGYWQSPIDNTWIGWVEPENNREYYVPDTLYEMSRQQFIDRQIAIHQVQPFMKPVTSVIDPDAPLMPDPMGPMEPMTDQEVIDFMGNWYDTFITGR